MFVDVKFGRGYLIGILEEHPIDCKCLESMMMCVRDVPRHFSLGEGILTI